MRLRRDFLSDGDEHVLQRRLHQSRIGVDVSRAQGVLHEIEGLCNGVRYEYAQAHTELRDTDYLRKIRQ